MDRDYFAINWLYDADGKGWDISMETLGDYWDECWVRHRYDKDYCAVPGTDYDEYFKNQDEHISTERIGDVPEVEDKFKGILSQNPHDPYRSDRYMNNMLSYCDLKKADLATRVTSKRTSNWMPEFLPPDLIHLHDAVFLEGEEVENPEIKMPDRVRHWWDSDVISEEFGDTPTEKSSAEYRVDWYLHQAKKGETNDNTNV